MTDAKLSSEPESSQNVSALFNGSSWKSYLEDFHRNRPGITEDILAHATGHPLDPYQWIFEPLPMIGTVLDLACGSSPFAEEFEPGRWIGIDRSTDELARARRRGVEPLVRADAVSLPLISGAFQGVVCSMAIMLLQPFNDVLAEIHRVLVYGGTAVFMLPGSRPLRAADLLRYVQLMVVVRRTHLSYPNDRIMAQPNKHLTRAGYELVADERLRFAYAFTDKSSTALFVDSLYLPSVSQARMAKASRLAARWEGSEIGIPLRRIVIRAV